MSYCVDYSGIGQICPNTITGAGIFPFEIALIGIIIVSIVTVFVIKHRIKVVKEPLAKVEI